MTTAWKTKPEAPVTPPNLRGAWAAVNLEQIRENIRILDAHSKAKRLCAIVKADAYGHGAPAVGKAALEAGADRLGVATILEGVELRKSGITAPILVLSEVPVSSAPVLVEYDLTPALFTQGLADAIANVVRATMQDPHPVHLKLETGMGRVGLVPEEVADAAEYLSHLPELRFEGVFSHFACADEADLTSTHRQHEIFMSSLSALRKAGIDPEIVHIANSAATLALPEYHHDMVRPGLSIYGYSPAPHIDGLGIKPCMAITGLVNLVKAVPKGTSVSYGHTWTAKNDTVIASLPIGYADGVRRALSSTGEVWLNGRRVPIVGRVCMDQLLLDLGPNAEDAVGDQVWLLGGTDGAPDADDWAQWADTISWEILAGLGNRLERVLT
ncbi:alanine racemase [Stomatohabitans albus]|uniref:alanine racemase n=1 Tax=Stomatohabitans albus TaxID=3110766 RepID=UPI00300D2B2D